jgi:Tfp pilus assembly protein FimT
MSGDVEAVRSVAEAMRLAASAAVSLQRGVTLCADLDSVRVVYVSTIRGHGTPEDDLDTLVNVAVQHARSVGLRDAYALAYGTPTTRGSSQWVDVAVGTTVPHTYDWLTGVRLAPSWSSTVGITSGPDDEVNR